MTEQMLMPELPNCWVEVNADGTIRQYTSSPEQPRAMFGGAVHRIAHAIDPSRFMYVDGALLDIGERPSFDHYIDPDTRTWVVPGKSALQSAQDTKWSEIKAERDRREQSGFPYMGGWLQSDPVSVHRMTVTTEVAKYAMANGIPFQETWKAADNTRIPMTAEDVVGMLPAFGFWGSQLHAIARQLEEAIYAEDATLESIQDVAWPESS